jgi:very-short-patch-repair endonuclease
MVPQPSEVPISAADPAELLAASIENWKRKLLDLTKRNRALNFRPTRVSTITIVDEQPAEVFRQLSLRERPMRFKAALEKEGAGQTANEPSLGAAEMDVEIDGMVLEVAEPFSPDEENHALALDFVPYDPSSLNERHTDDWLQTTSTPESLDKSLRRLDEQSRLSLEEQGVNTLFLALGMLHYTEADDSSQILKAPLLLLPVELTRKSARSGYAVRATDDDPLLNPALVEYLRRSFGITLPAIPDSSAIPDDYDLQRFLSAASESIALQKGWTIKTSIYLALFSFQKFVMYKDLEANSAAVQQHRILRQLVTRDGERAFALPDEIRALELDQAYPPETTFQVVDADASQLRVIAASSRNYDLVIQGPPGTGKSQTITNLIAQALANGKSVLFVAEKMAALQVVHNRLANVGLGEFCIELHSKKANKRDVMKGVAASLDASLQRVAAPTVSTQRLPQVRATLSEYVEAVHASHGALGISPYQAYGELGRVLGARRWIWSGPAVSTVTREQLDEAVRQLQDLAAVSAEVGVPARHPWRDTSRTFYSQHDLEMIQDAGSELARQLKNVQVQAEAIESGFQLPPIRTFSDIETAAGIAALLARSPGAPLDVLASDSWNAPPPEALALIERGRTLQKLAATVGEWFTPAVCEQEHASDIDHIERRSKGFLSFLASLDSRYRAVKRRWLAYRLPAYQRSLAEQADDMKQVDRLRREREAIQKAEPQGRAFFGALWQGEQSNWDLIENYVQWIVEFRTVCIRHKLAGRAFELAASAAPDTSEVKALSDAAVLTRQSLSAFRVAVGWPEDLLNGAPLTEISERVDGILQHLSRGPQWAAFESARQTAELGIAREIIASAMSDQIPFNELVPAFLRAFYLQWLSDVMRSRPPLEKFHTLTHEERVAEFRRLDERVLHENRAVLIGRLREQTQQRLRQPDALAALPFLQREMARQRGLSPLRRTLRQAGAAIRAIKPCFMMSPLTVAQYLDGAGSGFDLVIFDEASQLPVEDSVGSVLRGRQIVVVGDPKQLPPTNFFASSLSDVPAVAEDGTLLYEDSESILEELLGAGLHGDSLKWHYRSAHESLIHFSNIAFYDAGLYTFPSVETSSDKLGLRFEYIADGVYEGKGLNLTEARRVADEVVCFAREQHEKRTRGEHTESLGVGTFNLRQQIAIQDELEKRRRDEPALEPFFDRGIAEPFFVKNLENIQGDERDVIFLSVTYGPGPEGKIRYNFGPLNGQNGWRRLNVLTTRARHQMRVFSSMRGDDISATAISSAGASLLRDFLLYAERGRLDSVEVSAAADAESPFEQEVFQELSRRGVRLVPQVGVAKYRIDFGVLDESRPGRFLCGIECDGVAYHASETARDRDRLRQQVLESRGWTLYRVWSTDWFKDRAGQIDRLLRLIQEARTRSVEEAEAELQARERETARAVEEAEAARKETLTRTATTEGKIYERPVAAPYTITPGEGRFIGRELLEAPMSQLVEAVAEVVKNEAPIHATDLFSRVAGMWSSRVGNRIQNRLQEACNAAERGGVLLRRGEFFARPDGQCRFRSRNGMRIPANRIAPEEYAGTIRAVLASGFGFSRQQLIQEVRSILGFNRTGALLDEAIGTEIDNLLLTGELGEGSSGIRLRKILEDPASEDPAR